MNGCPAETDSQQLKRAERQWKSWTFGTCVGLLLLTTACAPLKYRQWYTEGIGSEMPNNHRYGVLSRINSESQSEKDAMLPALKQLYQLGDPQDKYWALEAAVLIGPKGMSLLQAAIGDSTACERFTPNGTPTSVAPDDSGNVYVEGSTTDSTIDAEAHRLIKVLKANIAEDAALKSGVFSFAQVTQGLLQYFNFSPTTPVNGYRRQKGIRDDGLATMFVTGKNRNIIEAEFSMQAPDAENGNGNTWQYILIAQLFENVGIGEYADQLNYRILGNPDTPGEWNFDTQFWHIYMGWIPGEALVVSIKKIQSTSMR